MNAVYHTVALNDSREIDVQAVIGRLLFLLGTLWAMMVQPLWEQIRAVVIVSVLGCVVVMAIAFRKSLLAGQSRVLVSNL